jgi:UrcA family protein
MTSFRHLALAVLACAAVPAAAETARIPVSYAGIDLTTPAGVAALDARIADAVDEICGRPFPATLQQRSAIRRCQQEAQASVQSQRAYALNRAQRVEMASRGN